MVRRHHCVKFVVPLNLLNLRWEHRPCMSLCLFFSRFKISPSLEHSDMYGIKRLATGNGVSRTKDLLFLHGELYASGLPFIIKDCLTWPCLSLTLHESGCLFCISTLTCSEGSSSLAYSYRLQWSTSVSVLVRASVLRGREDARRSWSLFQLHALLNSSGKRCGGSESAGCHGTHGLAVNSVVSITPVNLMAPYVISSCRLYSDLSLTRRTKTIHISIDTLLTAQEGYVSTTREDTNGC